MKKVTDFDLKGKTVILRCDLNVPIKDGVILDDTKIMASLKTIKYILESGARLVIMSHLGRVKTKEDLEKNDMRIVYDKLSSLIPCDFCSDTEFSIVSDKVSDVSFGTAILLQNTRFYDLDGDLESSCDMKLSRFFASLGDIFINDAFATIHRKHASNYGISSILESGAGFLMMDEILSLNVLDNPERPFVVIMGGAKVEDKIGVMKSLLCKCDKLLIGGAMANKFLEGTDPLCLDLVSSFGDKIVLPIDSKDGFDIGDETISLFSSILKEGKTVFWNGPVGMYEDDKYSLGTKSLLEVISSLPCSIVGGGDMVAAYKKFGYPVTFASTGGGATLSYIESHDQPGLSNL